MQDLRDSSAARHCFMALSRCREACVSSTPCVVLGLGKWLLPDVSWGAGWAGSWEQQVSKTCYASSPLGPRKGGWFIVQHPVIPGGSPGKTGQKPKWIGEPWEHAPVEERNFPRIIRVPLPPLTSTLPGGCAQLGFLT